MADAGSSLRTYLLAQSSVSTLVGQRMYPDVLPQGATLPAIVYYRISTERQHTVSDCLRHARARFQVDCYAESRTAAQSVASAIRTCGVTAYKGTTDSIWFTGISIDSGDEHLTEPPTNGQHVPRYITTFDLLVSYREAT